MKAVTPLLSILLWIIPGRASGEFKEVRQTIFGMD
jgi:hypothetical protein